LDDAKTTTVAIVVYSTGAARGARTSARHARDRSPSR
jgi:hypothetical protein